MSHLKVPTYKRILLFVILIAFSLLVGSCKSKKKLVEKKEETVSVLQKNDIKTSEETKLDVKTFTISNSNSISIFPVDDQISSKVIYKGDTLSFVNAKVVLENKSTQETKEDNSITGRSSSDKGVTKIESEKSEKSTRVEKKGTHPALIWGGLLLFLIILVILYIKKQIPFL